MSESELAALYRDYKRCLNGQEWGSLGKFVDDDVEHNARPIGLNGYRDMLAADFEAIPDLRFEVELLVEGPSVIACRLRFDCTPVGTFLGLPVNGRRIRFAENVFYEVSHAKIRRVWSVIDKVAIEAQLGDAP